MHSLGRRRLATHGRRAAALLLIGYVAASGAAGCTFPPYQLEPAQRGQGGQGGSAAGTSSGGGNSAGANAGSNNASSGAATGAASAGGTGGAGASAGSGGNGGSGGDAAQAGAPDHAGGTGGVPPDGPLVFDDFEDGNDDDWFATSGDWQVVSSGGSNVYQVKTLLDASLFSVIGDLAWTDVAVETKVRVVELGGNSSSDLVGVFARFQSPASHYYVALRADGKLAIRKKVNTNVTLGTPVDIGIEVGKQYKVRFEVQQSELRAYVDDALVLSASDSEIASGRIAIGTDNARAEFDDVTVNAL